jgi:hypothetical protein
MKKKLYIGKSIGAFLVVLLLMPLGHALMALMEHFLAPETLHYCAFAMGFVGLVVTIWGVFAKGDTHQTIFGIVGAMLFWTGWVEFLFVYYAQRFGVHCDLYGSGVIQTTTQYVDGLINPQEYLINGTPLEDYSRAELKAMRGSRPEYLIMPATFGMWVVVMLFYVFCTKTGCDFINWLQNHCLPKSRRFSNLQGGIRVGIRNSSIVTFMEWNVMMWGIYLLLMFCYDPVFLGQDHPVTIILALVSLVSSILMLKKELHIAVWGRNIRYALATVIVFWTFVEIMARNGFFNEIWVDPMSHIREMTIILVVFIIVVVLTIFSSKYITTEES